MQAWESYSTARVQHDSRGGDVVRSEGSCHSRAHEGVVLHEHRTLRDGQRRDDGEGGQHHHDGEQHAQKVRQLARHEEVVAPRLHTTANSRALAVMVSTIARASLASGVGEELRFPSRRGHRAKGHSRRAQHGARRRPQGHHCKRRYVRGGARVWLRWLGCWSCGPPSTCRAS